MRLHLGRTQADADVDLDTTVTSRVVVLGDSGAGKTTICRFVARSWLASIRRRCVAVTGRPHELRGLATNRLFLHWPPTGCTDNARDCIRADRDILLVIDGADELVPATLTGLMNEPYGLIVATSCGSAAQQLADHDRLAGATYGLIGDGRRHLTAIQGRLDWPLDTIDLIACPRGHVDLPRHRWAM